MAQEWLNFSMRVIRGWPLYRPPPHPHLQAIPILPHTTLKLLLTSIMLSSTLLLASLLLCPLFTIVLGNCVMLSKEDLDPAKWIKQNPGLDYDRHHSIDSRHATFNNILNFDIPSNGLAKAWNTVAKGGQHHYLRILFQTSVLHRKDSINWQTDLSISASILDGTYNWKHPFRVRYILNDNKAYNYWIETNDNCVAGGFREGGAKAVPFFAGDIRKVELYMLNT